MSRPAIAIVARGPVMLASRLHTAVRAAMVALLVTDHADRVRATRSVAVWWSREVANTGLNTPMQVTRPNWTVMTSTIPAARSG